MLRSDDVNPAQLALHHAVESNNLIKKGRVGARQTNLLLLNVIKKDLKIRNMCLNNINDLVSLKLYAQDKILWKQLEHL